MVYMLVSNPPCTLLIHWCYSNTSVLAVYNIERILPQLISEHSHGKSKATVMMQLKIRTHFYIQKQLSCSNVLGIYTNKQRQNIVIYHVSKRQVSTINLTLPIHTY